MMFPFKMFFLHLLSIQGGSLLGEHLLGSLFEVRATLVVELLLRVSGSTLGLSVLQWRLLTV